MREPEQLQYSHYDWWTFPIVESSNAHRMRYALPPDAVQALRSDTTFIVRFDRGVYLMVLSWGWDLAGKCWVQNPGAHQVGTKKKITF